MFSEKRIWHDSEEEELKKQRLLEKKKKLKKRPPLIRMKSVRFRQVFDFHQISLPLGLSHLHVPGTHSNSIESAELELINASTSNSIPALGEGEVSTTTTLEKKTKKRLKKRSFSESEIDVSFAYLKEHDTFQPKCVSSPRNSNKKKEQEEIKDFDEVFENNNEVKEDDNEEEEDLPDFILEREVTASHKSVDFGAKERPRRQSFPSLDNDLWQESLMHQGFI